MTEPTPLADLGPSLRQLLDEAQALRKDVRSAERARRRENRIGLIVIGLLSLFVLLIGVVTWQNNRIVSAVSTTNATIVDCTSPAGACYRLSQSRTASVVRDLIKASTFVAQCARLKPGESGPGFDAYLESCVAAKLGQPAPTPKVSASPAGG